MNLDPRLLGEDCLERCLRAHEIIIKATKMKPTETIISTDSEKIREKPKVRISRARATKKEKSRDD